MRLRDYPWYPSVAYMAVRANDWLSKQDRLVEDVQQGGTWMPSQDKLNTLIQQRYGRVPPEQLVDLAQQFMSRVVRGLKLEIERRSKERQNPPLPRQSQLIGRMQWLFADALLKAKSRRKNEEVHVAEDSAGEGGEDALWKLQEAAEFERIGQGGVDAHLGHTGEAKLKQFANAFSCLYVIAPHHAVMILEHFYLTAVDTKSWVLLLRERQPELTPNACNIMVTKHKAWAVYRFLLLLFELEAQFSDQARLAARGQDTLVPFPNFSKKGCAPELAWKCFAIAHLRSGIRHDNEAAAQAKHELGLKARKYRAARDLVVKWSLRMLLRDSGAKLLREHLSTLLKLVLHLDEDELEKDDLDEEDAAPSTQQ